MRALVTGVAGFIGSALADALVARGDDVVGLDCWTPFYERVVKERNVEALRSHPRFSLVEADLGHTDLRPLLDGVDVVFHQAAQAGVRTSWADGFGACAAHNVLATQRLLEALRAAPGPRLVYASSSSIYGNAAVYPTSEDDLPRPDSPYGVTKLAAEHLCNLYASNWSVPVVSLRYFTVYGPRQRPDMAFHRMIEAALDGTPFPLYGDGSAVRNFTFVKDIVEGNLAAGAPGSPAGSVVNLAGGSSVSMAEVLELTGRLLGRSVPIERFPAEAGDVTRTGGSIERARALLGWEPRIALADGLAAEIVWHRDRRD